MNENKFEVIAAIAVLLSWAFITLLCVCYPICIVAGVSSVQWDWSALILTLHICIASVVLRWFDDSRTFQVIAYTILFCNFLFTLLISIFK